MGAYFKLNMIEADYGIRIYTAISQIPLKDRMVVAKARFEIHPRPLSEHRWGIEYSGVISGKIRKEVVDKQMGDSYIGRVIGMLVVEPRNNSDSPNLCLGDVVNELVKEMFNQEALAGHKKVS